MTQVETLAGIFINSKISTWVEHISHASFCITALFLTVITCIPYTCIFIGNILLPYFELECALDVEMSQQIVCYSNLCLDVKNTGGPFSCCSWRVQHSPCEILPFLACWFSCSCGPSVKASRIVFHVLRSFILQIYESKITLRFAIHIKIMQVWCWGKISEK